VLILLCFQGAQNRQGQLQPTGILKKPAEGDSQLSKQVNLVEPLLENKRAVKYATLLDELLKELMVLAIFTKK
jgi:hypothetical protein